MGEGMHEKAAEAAAYEDFVNSAPVTPTCPACEKEIDSLDVPNTGAYTFYLDKDNDDNPEYDLGDTDTDGEFNCPFCGFQIADDEDEATAFLCSGKVPTDALTRAAKEKADKLLPEFEVELSSVHTETYTIRALDEDNAFALANDRAFSAGLEATSTEDSNWEVQRVTPLSPPPADGPASDIEEEAA